jgi:hypothetical protein
MTVNLSLPGLVLLLLSASGAAYGAPTICSELFDESIPQLHYHQTLDQQLFKTYDVNQIGEAIVQLNRKSEQEHSKNLQDQAPINLMKDTDIILFMNSPDVGKIGDSGVLNLHITGTTSGTNNTNSRIHAEDNLSGVFMGTTEQAKKLRPKSAYLNIRSRAKLSRERMLPGGEGDYGGVGLVLKEYVKKRALWVANDSLTVGSNNEIFSSPEVSASYRGTFERGSIHINSDRMIDYYEAIIFGEITLKDIEYFLVEDAAYAESLRKYNKPIYLWNFDRVEDRFSYSKGPQIN